MRVYLGYSIAKESADTVSANGHSKNFYACFFHVPIFYLYYISITAFLLSQMSVTKPKRAPSEEHKLVTEQFSTAFAKWLTDAQTSEALETMPMPPKHFRSFYVAGVNKWFETLVAPQKPAPRRKSKVVGNPTAKAGNGGKPRMAVNKLKVHFRIVAKGPQPTSIRLTSKALEVKDFDGMPEEKMVAMVAALKSYFGKLCTSEDGKAIFANSVEGLQTTDKTEAGEEDESSMLDKVKQELVICFNGLWSTLALLKKGAIEKTLNEGQRRLAQKIIKGPLCDLFNKIVEEAKLDKPIKFDNSKGQYRHMVPSGERFLKCFKNIPGETPVMKTFEVEAETNPEDPASESEDEMSTGPQRPAGPQPLDGVMIPEPPVPYSPSMDMGNSQTVTDDQQGDPQATDEDMTDVGNEERPTMGGKKLPSLETTRRGRGEPITRRVQASRASKNGARRP